MRAMREMGNSYVNTELPITGVSNCVVHLVVLYLTTKNETTRKIYQKVCETFADGIITKQQVGQGQIKGGCRGQFAPGGIISGRKIRIQNVKKFKKKR